MWREIVNDERPLSSTRVSRNGQIVLPARARRAAGIEPGDLVVSVPVAPGVLLVEKVRDAEGDGRQRYEDPRNPLRGLWGNDPDAWVDDIRGRWGGRGAS